MRLLVLTAVAAAAALAAPAAPAGAFRLGATGAPVAGNPADRLASLPADPEEYDPATHCSPRPKPGTVALIGWLERNARGVSWGSYRCEKWGAHEASLHAENRAVDWHLDVAVPADRAAARRLIGLLLAPDRAGTPHALARRMGSRRSSGTAATGAPAWTTSRPTRRARNRNGDVRKHVNKTIAHRDHLHLGLSKAGAAKRTSFWTAGAAR
jgi:hypothetical protein